VERLSKNAERISKIGESLSKTAENLEKYHPGYEEDARLAGRAGKLISAFKDGYDLGNLIQEPTKKNALNVASDGVDHLLEYLGPEFGGWEILFAKKMIFEQPNEYEEDRLRKELIEGIDAVNDSFMCDFCPD